MSEIDEYRVEVCIVLRQLERLDKDEFTEDERADAEEVYITNHKFKSHHFQKCFYIQIFHQRQSELEQVVDTS